MNKAIVRIPTAIGFSAEVGPSKDAVIPNTDQVITVKRNLPLHRPVQKAQTKLKIGWHKIRWKR